MNSTTTRATLGLGLALTAMALGGCGSSDGDSSGDGTASASATVSGSESSSPTSAPSSSAATSPSSSPSQSATSTGPAACTADDLRVGVSGGDGAAGSTYYTVTLTNTSSGVCTTRGYGGVSLVSRAKGAPIGAPADRTRTPAPKLVTLKPGGRATATLQVVQAENFPAAKCSPTPAKGFRVYAPDQTRSTFVARPGLTACKLAGTHLMSLQAYKPAG